VSLMSIKNLQNEPLKVKNWNNPEKEETRIDYNLSIVEDNHWIQMGIEIFPDGSTKTEIKYNCSMDF